MPKSSSRPGPTPAAPARRRLATGLFRQLLDAAPDAMVVADENGAIVLVNSQVEQLFGWPREDLVGQPVEVLIPERFRETHVHHRTRYATGPKLRVMGAGLALRGRRRDGSEFPVDVSLSPLMFARRRFVIAAVRDVTERKRAEHELAARAAALARSNEELERFAYVASHDLQEPLRTVASYTQLLERRYGAQVGGGATAEYTGFITDAVRRMQELIEDLLAYSRVSSQGGGLVPTNLDEVLAKATSNLDAALRESGGRITHDPLPTLPADAAQLVQLFQNLLANALKFRGEAAPAVHVGARHLDNEWLISVADNGIGIDPAHFDRIFVIFQRLHTRDRFPGTGIGLAVCKKIVLRHGGRLWVESAGVGKGSTFFFTLPDVAPDAGRPL